MVIQDEIDMKTVDTLWIVFGNLSEKLKPGSKNKEIPESHRRGALMILSMLGKAKKDIISNNFDILLKNGLGDAAKVKIMTTHSLE